MLNETQPGSLISLKAFKDMDEKQRESMEFLLQSIETLCKPYNEVAMTDE